MPRYRGIGGYLGDSFLEDLIRECDKTPYVRRQDYFRKRDKALVAAVFLTGGYVSEVLTLRKRNFDFEDEEAKGMNAFSVKEMRVGRHREKKGKSRWKTRTFRIFYDDLLAKHLLDWIHSLPDPDDLLFKIDRHRVWGIIKPLGKRALDFSLSPTDLRVQRMYYLVKKRGYTPLDIQKYLGMRVPPSIFRRAPITRKSRQEARVLMESASFLGLDANWSKATCALQLQEVAMTLVAKRKKIDLDKIHVEKTLNRKIERLSFNDQYEAFSRQAEASFGIEMPILTTHLRKMRAKVLHEGYNPKPEETVSTVGFTIGLLQKLSVIK